MGVLSNRHVREIAGLAVGVLFRDERAGVQYASDGHFVRECSNAAYMVSMVMRHDEGVDPLDARVLHRRNDALGITTRRVQIPGIEQERLLGPEYAVQRRDDERGLAALGVDEINVRGVLPLRACGGRREKRHRHDREPHPAHACLL